MFKNWRWALKRVIRTVSADHLHNVIIPDPVDEEIQLEYLLLTAKGIVVLDVRATRGAIFAGERVDDWAVLGPKGRFTIRNPLTDLNARVMAVRTLAPTVPVKGYIAFTQPVRFAHDAPAQVVDLASLEQALGSAKGVAERQAIEAFATAWQGVKIQAKAA